MKLKNVLVIAIAIISLGLIVACSDDVVATKDNNLNAYRVTESNGAFVYNETKYETLQDALDAIEKGKGIVFPDGAKTIKVTRSVTGPVAKVAAEQRVVLDLGGNTLTFYGVKDSALTIGSGTEFGIVNGTLTLADKGNEDLAVIGTDGATTLELSGVTISAAGQKTIDATDVNRVAVLNGSSINGETILSGVDSTGDGKGFITAPNTSVEGTLVATDGTLLYVNNDMGAEISLIDSTITVSGTGHAIIDKVYGGYTVNAADESAITNNTGADITINTGICMITRGSTPTIYGNLEAALDSLDQDGLTIVLIDDEKTVYESALRPNNNYSVIIDLNGNDVTPIDTIEPIITVTNITSEGAITLKSSSDGSEFKGSITGTGTEEGTGITVDHVQVDGNVTSACSVTIQNGSIVGPTALVDVYAPVVTVINSKIGANTISANGTMSNPATSVSITNSNGTIRKIYAQAASSTATAITLSSSSSASLVVGDSTHDDSTTAEKENVLIANRGAVSITGYSTEYSVKVYENIVVSGGNLGTQKAEIYGTVGVTGNMTDGAISGSSPSYTYANGSKFGKGITVTGAGRFYGSTFNPNGTGLTANVDLKAATLDIGGATFIKTHYAAADPNPAYDVYYDLETSGADSGSGPSLVSPLTITASKGTAGNLISTGGSIKVDNSSISAASKDLTTLAVTAKASSSATYYDVFVYGPASGSTLEIGSVKFAKGVTSKRAIFAGAVGGASGAHVTSLTDGTYTPASGTTPANYTDGSTFNGAIWTTGLIDLTNSVLKPSAISSVEKFVYSEGSDVVVEEDKTAAITTRGVTFFNTDTTVYAGVWTNNGGSIEMTNSTGTAFKIVATNSGVANNLGTVTIDNSSMSTDTFSVIDTVTAVVGTSPNEYVGDVTIKGHSAAGNLVVDRVFANDIKISYATVNTNVTAKTSPGSTDPGDITTEDSIFEHTVTASGSITDGAYTSPSEYSNGSTFNGDVSAVGVITLYNSTTTSSVSSTGTEGKVLAYNASLGDATNNDYINASVVSITDESKIYLLGGIKGNGDNVPAASVTITDPAKYSSTASSISSITTASLSVTADNDNLTVTSAEAEGAATINGGTFNKTALSGTTNINGGKFTDGTASVDHSLSGTTTISGGTFTGAVVLSGNKANSITGCSFYDNGSYGSFEYSGSGSLNISGGSLSGTTTFKSGTTTITGGSFGHYNSTTDNAWTSFTGTADVYVDNLAVGLYLGDTSTSGFVTFTKGTVYVNSGAGLGYAGSHVAQTAYSDVLTICVVDNTTLESHVYLSSAVLNLKISVAYNKTLWFDASTSSTNYSMYLASSTGNYTLSGTFDKHDGASYIYYHQGVNITNNMSTGSDVELHIF